MKKLKRAQSARMPASGRGSSLELALEVSELRYRRLFETAQDGILILDAVSGRIIDANPFFLDLLDYPFESIIGLQLWEVGLFEDITANQAAFERLKKEEYIRYENHPLRTKAGREIQVEFVSNVYFVGSDKVIQCNIRDISERAELQKASKSALAALELASKAKDDVLGVLSHELRTPLGAISAMVDLLARGHNPFDLLPDASSTRQSQRDALAVIRRNVRTLVRLIDELLDLTHFAKGKPSLSLERIDLHEVIGFALKNLEGQQKAKEIAIELRLHAQRSHIQGDPVKLEQILSNLIGNALKFTLKGGRVSIGTREQSGGELMVVVSDTGIGIPEEALSRIFAPFEQGSPSIHPRFGGLGLGLSIAHTLVEAHGGSLQASSAGPNRGATFTARFKLEEPSEAEREEVACLQSAGNSGLRILLVEDHDDARRCSRALLESSGYDVQAAVDTKSALELNDWQEFDLLIADIGLPDGSGVELLQKLRSHAPNLQAIAVSGYDMPEDVARTRAAGFLAHLVKPVEFSQLQEAIERVTAGTYRAASVKSPE